MGVSLILIGATAYSASESRQQNKRLARENKKLRRVEMAQAQDTAARSRRQQIREARIASARIQNTAAAQGQEGSSAVIAATAGVQAQANEGIGLINSTLGFNTMKSTLEENIFKAQLPSTGQLVAGVVGQAAGSYASSAGSSKTKKG